MTTDIIRVFPRRTSYTHTDDMAFVGMPPLIIPEHKEIHVSCTFTWDRAICEELWIQDNNFLQTSRQHKDKVFEMLKTQKRICFKGGLEADLVDDHFVQGIRGLRIEELWLACDTDAKIPYLQKACAKLTAAGFNREKLKCYVLSYGKDRDKDETRARAVYEAGAMPFVQLYRDFSDKKTEYDADWNAWARMWQRPAAIRGHMEKGTDYREYKK